MKGGLLLYIFICENSIDGIFTAIYEAWASHLGHKNIKIVPYEPINYELFSEYIHVDTELEKSTKVSNTIKHKCGLDVWTSICTAAMAFEAPASNITHTNNISYLNKADAIYRVLLLGFSMNNPSSIMDCLANPYVMHLFKLCRQTTNEAHHLLGFVRFKELKNQILFASTHPKNYVLPILGDHFSDRLSLENFIIYDETRNLAILHPTKKHFLILDASSIQQEMLTQYSQNELDYQTLWCHFFQSIAIEARKNPNLQNQNIPIRFQKDAIEFQTSTPTASHNP